MIQYIHSKKKKNQNNLQYSLLLKTGKRKGGNFVTYDHHLIIHHSIISDHLRIRKKWSDDNLMKQHVVSPFVPVYFQVKEIEKRDSVLTSPQQIERLTRPGSTYFNLNPYEVSAYSLIKLLLTSCIKVMKLINNYQYWKRARSEYLLIYRDLKG